MTTDKPRKPFHCFDCGGPSHEYMVDADVWLQAWPDYPEFRREMALKYKKLPEDPQRTNRLHHLLLCFPCLEKRLGRELVPADFDLALPANAGIAKGMTMAGAAIQQARRDSKPRDYYDVIVAAGRKGTPYC